MSLFSKNLRFLRTSGKHRQESISLLFNKKANTIGNWENQKSEPSLTELVRLGEFFKVSTQDLLHTDLEKQSILLQDQKLTGDARQTVKTYEIQEPANSLIKESSADAFWLVLRELKALNEKIDLLAAGAESGGLKRNSDKSYH